MRQIGREAGRRVGAAVGSLALLAGLAALAQTSSGQWQEPAAELAHEIAGLTGPGTVSLTVKDASAIPLEEVPRIQAALGKELAGAGVQVRAGGEVSTAVRVTLSQSAREGVWVAEVQQGPEVKIAMIAVPLPAVAAKENEAQLVLRTSLVVEQTTPVLDAQFAGQQLVVLGPERVTLYQRAGGDGESAPGGGAGAGQPVRLGTLAVEHTRPFPRDVRGRIEVTPGGGWRAYLPGVICVPRGDGAASKSLACTESDDPWPLGSQRALFHAGRNFFTGVMVPGAGSDGPPFYSAAELSERRGGLVVTSLVSGGLRAWDGGAARLLNGVRDMGSDVAALSTGCGAGAQMLASVAGEGAEDSIAAYEIDGGEAVRASAPVPVNGRVTAMWDADPGVIVVAEREEPQRYEVYRVTGDCSR